MKSFLLFVSCLLSVTLISASSKCNVPPQFWCDDLETASNCGVTEQCKEFSQRDAEPVKIALYYESLCPGCRQFLTGSLYPAFKSIGEIMDITLVPYGNAIEHQDGKRWVFQCQHGEQECVGNLIETCAISQLKNVSAYFPFINCIEVDPKDVEAVAKECASKFKIDIQKILQCAKSDEGNKLEHEMAAKTDALKPPHQYVPWVTLNGVHTDKIQKEAMSDLVGLICSTYKGSPKPAACSEKPVGVRSMK